MHLRKLLEQLQSFGFTKTQARLYLSGLMLRHTLMTQLARTANVRRTTAYYLMKELMRRGFFTTKRIGKRIYYIAAPPKRLLEMTKEREGLVKRLLPLLRRVARNID